MDQEGPGPSSLIPHAPMVRALSLPGSPRQMPFIDERRTGIVYDVRMMLHSEYESAESKHPDQPARISSIFETIVREGRAIRKTTRLPARVARKDEIILVHSEDHWQKVNAIQFMGEEALRSSRQFYETLSLYVHRSTPMCAELSCGGVIDATLAVARGHVRNAFAIVRPPGHHAEPEEHMGFCFYNNVAVAARVAQAQLGIKRILILDWDVHHGNGTQRAFYDDPNVLYISLHRYEGGVFYPGGTYGGMDMCGEGHGLGKTVNIPWPCSGVGDAEYLYAFQKIVMPIAHQFQPEIVIVSAGFDAAEGDSLGECLLTPAGYAMMTHFLMSLADGKVVVALEGGYNLVSISRSALAVAQTLVGDPPPPIGQIEPSDVIRETIWQVAYMQSKHWTSIDPPSCEPRKDHAPVPTVGIPELLKAHRSRYMYSTHGMMTIPLAEKEMEDVFGEQVMCSEDIYGNHTMVLFVHDFGNLMGEITSPLIAEIKLEHSYLVDSSRSIVEWTRKEGYSLLDINLLARPLQLKAMELVVHSDQFTLERQIRQLMTYIWDNYVDLSDAKDVILIGHGWGCGAIMNLLHERAVQKKVKAVVQVNGMNTVPKVSRDEAPLRIWYLRNSLVIVPARHPLFAEDGKILKRHGKVVKSEEEKASKVLIRSIPEIRSFVHGKLGTNTPTPEPPPPAPSVSSLTVNGNAAVAA